MNGKLHIETTGSGATVEIEGRAEDIIFSYVALTHALGNKIGLPAEALALMLPRMLRDYRQNVLAGSTEIDVTAMRRQMGGGQK